MQRFPALVAGSMSRSASLVAAAGALVVALLIALTSDAGAPQLVGQSMPLTSPPGLTKSLPTSTGKSSAPAAGAFGRLPLSFIENRGQVDRHVAYYAQAPGASFYFTKDRATFAFTKGKKGEALELRFLHANPSAHLDAGRRASGRVNYLRLMPVTYVVILIFGAFSLLTIAADILNPVTLTGR